MNNRIHMQLRLFFSDCFNIDYTLSFLSVSTTIIYNYLSPLPTFLLLNIHISVLVSSDMVSPYVAKLLCTSDNVAQNISRV